MGSCPLASSPKACIDERRRSMRLMPGDPRNWSRNPCPNCLAGKQHEIANHTPEPDADDIPRTKYIYRKPCKVCGVMLKQSVTGMCKACWWQFTYKNKIVRKCRECDKPCANNSVTGLCHACYTVARKKHGKDRCKASGCINKAHVGGMCKRHRADRMREAQAEYRAMSHRIVQYRKAAPRQRIIPGQEPPAQ